MSDSPPSFHHLPTLDSSPSTQERNTFDPSPATPQAPNTFTTDNNTAHAYPFPEQSQYDDSWHLQSNFDGRKGPGTTYSYGAYDEIQYPLDASYNPWMSNVQEDQILPIGTPAQRPGQLTENDFNFTDFLMYDTRDDHQPHDISSDNDTTPSSRPQTENQPVPSPLQATSSRQQAHAGTQPSRTPTRELPPAALPIQRSTAQQRPTGRARRPGSHACTKCTTILGRSNDLRRHTDTIHGKSIWKCNFDRCNYETNRPRDKKKLHAKKKHGGVEDFSEVAR